MKKTLCLLVLSLVAKVACAQSSSLAAATSFNNNSGWLNKLSFAHAEAFIENVGQFDEIPGTTNHGILYQIEDNNMQVSFTAQGVIYQISKREKVNDRAWEKYAAKNHFPAEGNEEKEKEAHYIPKISMFEMNWQGANANFEISAEEPLSSYFNYYSPYTNKDKMFAAVKGYKKIVYKNVYPFIDVEYTLHPEDGIKYSYILHPGANPSAIRMQYAGATIKFDDNKDLQFVTNSGNLIDHAPLTYTGNFSSGKIIASEFVLLDKSTVGFKLASGNLPVTTTTVIDPWQVGPSFPANGYTPNDLSVDGSGNIVVYSIKPPPFLGTATQRLDKYNSAGVLQWTYMLSTNAGYTNYQGDVACDPAGNVYASIGLGPNNNTGFYNTIKLNPAGTAMIWGNSSAGTGANNMMETWTVTFNCTFSQFYQSGGGRIVAGTTYFNMSVEEPVNAATGVEGTLIENDSLGDIYCTYYSPDGYVYHMAGDSNVTPNLAGGTVAATTGAKNTLLCFNPGTGVRLFRVKLGASYNYTDGDVKAPYSVGFNGMVSSCQYLYTISGSTIDRWNSLTGAHLGAAAIPGGVAGGLNAGLINAGIITDKCGNVYVGSNGNIYKFDPLLNLIGSVGTFPGIVFDLAWANAANTDIVACGGTTNGTTFLKDISVAACVLPNQVTIAATQPTCATPVGTATATATFCGAPYSYSWSNGQNTQVATGLAPGIYTVTVGSSISCPYSYVETQTVTINVAPGSPTVTVNSPTICAGNSTTLNAAGATTYSWAPGTGLSATTGASVTANPGTTTTYTITGTTAGCTGTVTSVVTVNPTPTLTVNSPTICNGASSVLTAAGASTYTWSPATGLSATTGASVTANPTATTIYTITGTSVGGCTATVTSTVTVNPTPTVTVNSPTICNGASAVLTAAGASTYTWSPATGLSATTGASVTANPTATTVYTITATSVAGCTTTATSTVTVNPTPTLTVNSPSICPGNTVTLTAAGANTYTWSPATGLSATTGASVVANPTVTTTYTITGTSVAGCTATVTSTVTIGGSIVPTVNSATICVGNSTTLTAAGGTTYTWSPATGLSSTSGATVTANPITTTTYTINAASGGCTGTTTAVVTVNPLPTITANSGTICIGQQTATLTANGASTYTWSPATGLSATTGASVTANPGATTVYTITGTNANGCVNTGTASVTVNPLPTITANSATICVGQQTATLTANGGSTYTWSPATGLSSTNGSPVTATPGATTSYTVWGTNANGCVNSGTATVTVNPLPIVNATNGTVCNGGSVTLNAGGASTYTWSPATGLSSTTGASVTANPTVTTNYTITGTDANGCVNTNTTSVTVVTNPTVTVAPATICVGSSTTLTANGASTYSWSPATGLSSTSGTSVTANPVTTTVYTITGTAGTCTTSATTTVTVNPLPTVTANSATICLGAIASCTVTGATTYTWSNGTTAATLNVSPGATTNYTVTGTDANGCVNTSTISVVVNPLPTITATNGFVCNGSSVTLTANGANTYTWSPGTGLSSTTGASVTASPSVTTQYTITGTDANGCTNTDTTTVTVVSNPTVTASAATICVGASATLTANGAVTYSWSPATGLSSTSGTSVTANPVTTTVYTITGTAGTCTAVGTTTVTVNPLPPAVAGSNSPLCVNQNLNLTSGGGTGYSWSGPNFYISNQQNPTVNGVTLANSGVYTVTVTDANTCVNTATVNVVINSLPVVVATGATVCIGATINLGCNNSGVTYSWSGPNFNSNQQNPSIPGATTTMSGNYVVTVTDANGCSSGDVASVVVNPSLVINAANNGPLCVNSTLNLTASTGVSWVWTGPNSFGSFSQNPSIANVQVVAAGTYTVVGTDANGCQGTATTNVVINPLPVITANSSTICVTQQTATLTANGASTYTWTPSITLSSGNGTTVTGTPMVTTVYTVTGTDANGCVSNTTTSILVNQLPNVTATSGTICVGSSTALTANGASTYSWTPSGSLSSATGSPVTASPLATTSYSVTGTDANGCYSSALCSVTVNALPNVNSNAGTICQSGSVTLNATGANTYAWSPAGGLSASTGASVSASPASTTTYVVTGTDINGCKNTDTVVVTVNPLPVLNVGPQITTGCSPVCVSLANTTSVTGTCSWNFGDGTTSASCAPSHCYIGQGTFNAVLSFTDGNGCKNTDTAKVVVYPIPHADFYFGPQPTTIFEPQITFTDASSGAVISNWNWSFGDPLNSTATTQNTVFTYSNTGSYAVQLIVTSNYGCVDSVTKTVVIDEDFMIYVPNAFSPNFDQVNDVFMAKGEGIKTFKMYIFDRWGEQVFFSDDIDKGWDGRFMGKGSDIVQEDVYVWKIELRTFKDEPRQLKGTVSLIK